jgi:CRP-like cAMP-binding protein
VSLDFVDEPCRASRAHLGRQQKEVLARLFTRRRYPKDAVVLHRGETSEVMFMVCRGTIQIATENEWGHTTAVSQGEGDVFGEEILLGGGQSTYQATALEDSELCLLDRSDLDELSAQAPAILAEIMKRVAGRLRSISESLQNQSRRSTDVRLPATPLFDVRAARLLASRGGSPLLPALFVIGLAGLL